MKSTLGLLFILIAMAFPFTESSEKWTGCPDLSSLEQTSVKDREGLLKALKTIVPQKYNDDASEYLEWEIVTVTPFLETLGHKDEIYYKIAENLCGKEVANKSWLARVSFPEMEGKSASMSEGQMFLAKSKEQGWLVWFMYH